MIHSSQVQLEPVTFCNRDGLKLFGIVHRPTGSRRQRTGVVLLSPGVKSRVAPHRLYNKLADHLAAEGFTVLRFDFSGLGDSEGDIDEPLLADFYGTVQLGRYVSETEVALQWMREAYGFRRFVLGGLCGGAITALLAAERQRQVVGILGLGLPVMLQGTQWDARRYMTTGQLNNLGTAYLRKLSKPAAWLRLLTLRTDFRLLARAVRVRLSGVRPAGPPQGSAPPDNTNPLVAPAFTRVLQRGCQVLLLFGGADRLHWEFEEKYLRRHGPDIEKYRPLMQVDVVPDANHVLTFTEWQVDTLQRSTEWVSRHFRDAGSPRVAPRPEVVTT